jgi:meso-butanediol dehydrogenase/(S,S)-butanediol dehydrogenase/diacetyl reductase
MTMKRFNDHVVIVTGSGSGIGEATAVRFAQEGACVVLTGRTPEKLQRVASALDKDRTFICPGDVSEPAFAPSMVEKTVKRFGKINTLVNNAGIAISGPLLDKSVSDFRQVMAINVEGVVLCTQATMPELLKTRGSVVNVSSVSGLGGDWKLSFYNASKGAVTNFTRALALEFGGQGVRVNAVNPSLTRSDMTASIFAQEDLMAKFRERIPMGRAAEATEVAAAIAFLASADASFINGVNLPVDGGVSASNGQPAMS